MISLLEALSRNVKHIGLAGEPVVAMNNTIRAWESLPVVVERDTASSALGGTSKILVKFAPKSRVSDKMQLRITERHDEALDTISLTLAAIDGEPLPAYEAGAHVDVRVRGDLLRQ